MRNIVEFVDYLKGRPVFYTKHAQDRSRMTGRPFNQIKHMLFDSINNPVKLDYKHKKYQSHKDKVKSWVNGTTIYTTIEEKDRNSHNDIILVLTVSDLRNNVKI